MDRVYIGTYARQQIWGLPAAAQSYLRKPLVYATDEKFIGMVAMIKAPNFYNPVRQPAAYTLLVARVRVLVHSICKLHG